MDLSKLTSQQRQVRAMIRGFLLVAPVPQLEIEKAISLDIGDQFRADVIQEMIDSEQPTVLNEPKRLLGLSLGFLLTATVEKMEQEKAISLEFGDQVRADAIQEIIDSRQ